MIPSLDLRMTTLLTVKSSQFSGRAKSFHRSTRLHISVVQRRCFHRRRSGGARHPEGVCSSWRFASHALSRDNITIYSVGAFAHLNLNIVLVKLCRLSKAKNYNPNQISTPKAACEYVRHQRFTETKITFNGRDGITTPFHWITIYILTHNTPDSWISTEIVCINYRSQKNTVTHLYM